MSQFSNYYCALGAMAVLDNEATEECFGQTFLAYVNVRRPFLVASRFHIVTHQDQPVAYGLWDEGETYPSYVCSPDGNSDEVSQIIAAAINRPTQLPQNNDLFQIGCATELFARSSYHSDFDLAVGVDESICPPVLSKQMKIYFPPDGSKPPTFSRSALANE